MRGNPVICDGRVVGGVEDVHSYSSLGPEFTLHKPDGRLMFFIHCWNERWEDVPANNRRDLIIRVRGRWVRFNGCIAPAPFDSHCYVDTRPRIEFMSKKTRDSLSEALSV